MSDSTIDPTILGDDDFHAEHVAEKSYWIVFLSLAIITAVEIAWSYLGLSGIALVVPLVIMMIVKFFVVAGVFMHLYFDLKFVNGKYFSIMFGFGLVLAVAVFLAVVASFDFKV
ncbi:MAG: cytochrome C oxidase subunit IV family protein [Acidimicrobiales bacterium]